MDEAKNFMLGMMQTLKERIGNPFIGAFAAAWFVWNFRIVLVVLGKGPWEAKIKYIYEDFMPTRLDWFLHGYLIPGIGAAIWIFLLPPIFRWITVFHEKQLNKNREAIYGATEQKILTKEEAISLRTHVLEEKTKLLDEKEKFSKSLTENALEIQNLNSKLNSTTAELSDAVEVRNKLQKQNTEYEGKLDIFAALIKEKIYHLDFYQSNITIEKRNAELLAIGFKSFQREFSHGEALVVLDNDINHWPLVSNGSIIFRGHEVLKKGLCIEEACAAAIIIISALHRKRKIDMLPFNEVIYQLSSISAPNALTSLDQLINLNLITIQSKEAIIPTANLLDISTALKDIGFRISPSKITREDSRELFS